MTDRPLHDDDVVVELGDGNLYHFSPGEAPPLPDDAACWTFPFTVDPPADED